MVNALLPSYLLIPSSGELFEDLEEYNCRLYDYTLVEGFNIVKYKGNTKILFNYRFKYIFYGNTT